MILFVIRPRKRHLRDGYLFCPRCYCRTPGELFLVEDRFYLLGLVPLGPVGESRNFLACRECGGQFEEAGDWAFDFGDHREPRVWECRRCGEQNTSERFHCRRCGRRV